MKHTKQLFLLLLLAIVSNVAAWGEEKTFSFAQTSSSEGTLTGAPEGVTATFNNTYKNNKEQLTSENSMTLTITGLNAAWSVTGVDLLVKNNKSSGSGSATASIGSSTIGSMTITGLGDTYQTKAMEVTSTKATYDLVIKISATVNSVYCKKFVIHYDDSGDEPVSKINLDSFSFSETTPTINLANSTTYSQEVSFAPLDYDGDITYALSNNTAGATISGSTVKVSQAGSVKVTASGTATTKYNKPNDASYVLTVTNSGGSTVPTALLKETFDKFSSTGGNDGQFSGNVASATFSTSNTDVNWTKAGKVYAANKCARIGSTTEDGSITSPVVSLTGDEVMTFRMAGWNNNGVHKLVVIISYGDNKKSQKTFTATNGEWKTFTWNLADYTPKIQGNATIKFSGHCFFLDDICVSSVGEDYISAPVISPDGGSFPDTQEVTITAGEGCTIYYTIDGSDPSAESTVYTAPFTINTTTTVKAIAIKNGKSSSVASATFSKQKADPNLAFSGTSVTANIGESFTPPTLSYAEGYDGTITYSSSNSAITVNAETGAVSFDASATGKTTTITATASGTDNFSAGTASYVLTVVNPNAIEGNLNNETFGTNYTGSITPISEFSSVSGNIGSVVVTYAKGTAEYAYINDSQIRMYNGSKLTFTAPDGVYILSLTFNTDLTDCSSDNGTISGNTWLPGDEEEVNSVTITRGGSILQLSTVTITLSQSGTAVPRPRISPVSGTQINENTPISITSEEGITIYYTTDGSNPIENGALTGTAKAYTSAFKLTKAGTVKAVARDAEGNFSIIASATYNYNGTTALPYYERFDAGLGNFITVSTGNVEWDFKSHDATPEFIAKYGEERKYAYASRKESEVSSKTGMARLVSPIIDLTNISNAKFSFIHAGAYFTEANKANTCKVQIITDKGERILSDESVLNEDANWESLTIPTWFETNTTFPRTNSGDIDLSAYKDKKVRICFLYDATDDSNYGRWNVDQISIRGEVDVEIVNIAQPSGATGEGYTTYVTKNDIDAATTLTNKVKLYKVVEFDRWNVVLVQLGLGTGTVGENTYSETVVPAETPILVKGEFGERELVLVNSHEVIPKLRGNLLRSAVEGVKPTADDAIFVLQYPQSVGAYGFHKLSTGRKLEGRRAYLNGVDEVETLTSQTNSAKGVFLFGEEEDVLPLNIQQLDVHASSVTYSDGIYDLMGRKVNASNGHLPKGIYVVKGKKFVVK